MSMSRTILVAGATGLVGRYCLEMLLDDPLYSRVTVLTRRPLPKELTALDRGNKLDVREFDFSQLLGNAMGAAIAAAGAPAAAATAGTADGTAASEAPAAEPAPLSADQILCTIGTTIRQAGSRERFREIDHDYVVGLGRLGLRIGARHFLVVTALGADAASRVFYNRVKGEVEKALRALAYPSLTIVRPSLLLGPRVEFRFLEEVIKRFGWAAPPRYRPVHARLVAATLLAAARADRPGERVIESHEILAAARERERELAENDES